MSMIQRSQTNHLTDTPDIPGVVDNIGTLQETAAKPTPDDIVNDSEDVVKPASIDNDNSRMGDGITPSSSQPAFIQRSVVMHTHPLRIVRACFFLGPVF
jgi:hypothetical protein